MKRLSASNNLKVLMQFVCQLPSFFYFPYRSPQDIEAYQLERIKKIVAYAYRQVPFYKRKYDKANIRPKDIRTIKDFKRLPLVTKEELINDFPKGVLAKGVDLECSIISLSSGSSGKTIKVVYDPLTLGDYMAIGLRTYAMGLDWRPWYKQVSIYSSCHPLDDFLGSHWVNFIPTIEKTEIMARKLLDKDPDFLSCYASVLNELRAYMIRQGMAPSKRLKAIFVNSEMSSAADRKKLADFFGCPVYDEYSSEELNRIAAQCRYYQYHVFEDVNFIEILDAQGHEVPEGTVGEVVGTHLLNFQMPFIRYKQGDLASTMVRRCSCGMNFKVLDKLQGRLNSQFILPTGKVLSSGFLLDLAYSMLLAHPDDIADFCMIQESKDKIAVEILPVKECREVLLREIKELFVSAIGGGVSIEIRVCQQLTKTASGCKNPIISKVRYEP